MLFSHQSFVVHGRVPRAPALGSVGNSKLDSRVKDIVVVNPLEPLQKFFDAANGPVTRLHNDLDGFIDSSDSSCSSAQDSNESSL